MTLSSGVGFTSDCLGEDLPTAMLEAVAAHPRLAASQYRARALTQRAQSYGLPKPTVSAGINNLPISSFSFDEFLPTNKALGVSQAIPNPWRRKASRSIDQEAADLVLLEKMLLQRRLAAQLTGLLADRQRLTEQQKVAQEQLSLYRQMEDLVSSGLTSGETRYYRFSQVDGERTDVARRLNALQQEVAAVDARIGALIGDAARPALTYFDEPVWDREPASLWQTRIAEQAIRVSSLKVAREEEAYKPDFGLSMSYQQREPGLGFQGDDWMSVGVSMSVPVWTGGSIEPRIASLQAEEAAARADLQAIFRDATAHMDDLYSQLRAARRDLILLEEKDTVLRDQEQSAQRDYEAGTGDFEQVLEASLARLNIDNQLAQVRSQIIQIKALLTAEQVIQ